MLFRWARVVRHAMLAYFGIRLVERELSIADRSDGIISADYISDDDW